jgi:hypothetical protein
VPMAQPHDDPRFVLDAPASLQIGVGLLCARTDTCELVDVSICANRRAFPIAPLEPDPI